MASTTAATTRTRTPKNTRALEIKLSDVVQKVLLTTDELAVLLSGDISVRTLEDWRRQGLGPDFVTLSSKMVRYRRAAVDRWLLEGERKTRARDAA